MSPLHPRREGDRLAHLNRAGQIRADARTRAAGLPPDLRDQLLKAADLAAKRHDDEAARLATPTLDQHTAQALVNIRETP